MAGSSMAALPMGSHPRMARRVATMTDWKRDELLATIAEQDQQIEALKRAIGGFRWLGNNLHNAGTQTFRKLYIDALGDARDAMGDDWEPLLLEPRR